MTASRARIALQPGRRAAGDAARARAALALPARARHAPCGVAGELPEGCVALLPDDVADTRALRLPRAGHAGARARRRALRRRPRRRRRRARRRARPRGALVPSRSTTSDCPRRPTLDGRARRAARRRSTTSHELAARPGAWTRAAPARRDNVLHRFRLLHGRGEAGFDEAEVVVEGEWDVRRRAARADRAARVRSPSGSDGRLTVWTGTQTPFNVRRELAGTFGLDEADVRVVSPPMGGSLRRQDVHAHRGDRGRARAQGRRARCARAPARRGVPDARTATRRASRVRLGARRDGTFVARRVWADWDTGAYADTGPNVAAKGGWAAVGPVPLRPRRGRLALRLHEPPVGNGAFRGYAATQAVWASEQCVDLLAERLGVDPLELRLRNVLRDGDRFATGEMMHDFHVAECLERVAERIGWSDGRRGKGLCALMKGMQTPSRSRGAHRARRRALHGRAARRPRSARGATARCRQLAAELARRATPRSIDTRRRRHGRRRRSTRARRRAARRT